MIMAEKKDRGRYTLRLNEKDPAHAEVIRVLEQLRDDDFINELEVDTGRKALLCA